ncbi:MAG: molybdenum cofactor biosynthesis protein MoaE [Nitrospiraceae bacterium]
MTTTAVTVSVRLFGMTKMLAQNRSAIDVTLGGGSTVADLVAQLTQDYPAIADLIHAKKVLVSVNQDIAQPDQALQAGDELALLPPFAGGSGVVADEEAMLVRVQQEDFSLDEEMRRVRNRSTRIGGIAMFLGTARDRSKGRDVSGITFEHYEGMAQKKLREIRERAIAEFGIIELLILHRYGPIAVGENIVLIIAGSEHRAEAFRACKWAIDELKQITPIWKLEQTSDGEVWVEEHP